MNDVRFPGLRGAVPMPAPSEAAASNRKVGPSEPATFERAIERSVSAGPRTDERPRDRGAESVRHAERGVDRVQERTPERSAERSMEHAHRSDQNMRVRPADESAAGADAEDSAAEHDAKVTTEPFDTVAQAATTAPIAVAATDDGADATLALLVASTALSGASQAASAADDDTPEVVEGDVPGTEGSNVAVRAPAVRADVALGISGKSTKAGAAAAAAAAPGKAAPGTLPELTADLTRTPAKDRLLEDFERRFESSLARAAGANGLSPLSGLSPLASAGLPVGMQAAGAAAPMALATVQTPIGHAAFAADLAHRVLLFAGQRVQSAQITVTPNDLGPIRVSIEMHGQEAAIQFTAAHATTRAAIEDAMPRLREMFAAQGLQLTQADVGDHAQRDAHAAFSDRSQQRSSAAGANLGTGAAGATPEAERSTLRRIGLIDIRV